MLRTISIYGVIAGVIVGIAVVAQTYLMKGVGHLPAAAGMAIGYTTMLIALSAVFMAIKRRRDIDQGGVIKFWPAFGMGLAISLVAGVFYVVAWEAAQAITHMDFATDYSKSMIDHAKASGASAAAIAKATAEAEQFRVQYANPLYRWPMTFAEIFPVGVLVSLVSAALLRNSRFLPTR